MIYAYFDSFWVLESNGILPRNLNTLCSVGIWKVEDEEAVGYVEMDAKSKKCILLN